MFPLAKLKKYFKVIVASYLKSVFISFLLTLIIHVVGSISEENVNGLVKCTDLLMGQYLCSEPEIDPSTQQAKGCEKETLKAIVWCTAAPGIDCNGLYPNRTFSKQVPCKWTNGHSFETALLLSIFLGMFGIDRFYLGYPALGLIKFATLGLMFLGQLIDVLLIATQVLTPSDGSSYVIDYYGAATLRVSRNNETFLVPGD